MHNSVYASGGVQMADFATWHKLRKVARRRRVQKADCAQKSFVLDIHDIGAISVSADDEAVGPWWSRLSIL